MGAFLARRALMLVAALLVSSFVIFGSLDLAPGDPLSTLTGGRTLPPEAVAQLRAQYHLDDTFLVRYADWLGNAVLHGDLGTSIAFRGSVASRDRRAGRGDDRARPLRRPPDRLFGVGLGVVSGLRRGALDTSIVASTSILAAVPSFVAAIILLSVFSVNLGWFPALGAGEGFADRIWHLTLPAIALALSAMAIVVRVTRVAVRTEMSREHVQTAVSRGIPSSLVVRRHVLRNAAIPMTTVVGITITSLIALSAVVERAFSLNGLGAALVQAALSKDFAVVQGISLILVDRVRRRERGRGPALRRPRPARGDREPGGMSTLPSSRGRPRAPPARSPTNNLFVIACGTVIAVAVFLAIFGPLLAPHDPNAANLANAYVGPVAGHALGLRRPGPGPAEPPAHGRADVDRRAVPRRPRLDARRVGARGHRGVGGRSVDASISTVLDILFAFPAILLAVLAAAVFGAGLTAPTLALAIA